MLLRRGLSGAAVRNVAEQLVGAGYLAAATSEFDWAMDRAVRAFQAQHLDPRGEPLDVDGIVGPLTRAALDASSGARGPIARAPTQAVPAPAAPPRTMPQAALAVALAEERRGAGEAGGNNRGPDIRLYLDGRAPEGSDWCAGFVSHCFREGARTLGREMPFAYSVGARAIRNELRRRGFEYAASHENPPRPGDVVTWWRGAYSGWQGHIGIVQDYADGIVTVIEGNRGSYPSRVGRFRYVLGRIDRLLGFARLPD